MGASRLLRSTRVLNLPEIGHVSILIKGQHVALELDPPEVEGVAPALGGCPPRLAGKMGRNALDGFLVAAFVG
jgi:hypothetical protein